MEGINSIDPTWGNILILLDEAPEKTAGGLFIPEMSKQVMLTGTVVKTGTGKIDNDGKLVKSEYSPGDRVAIGRHVGYKLVIDSVEFKMMEERYVVSKVKAA